MDLSVSSSAFNAGEMIPAKYTFDGENISPMLQWTCGPVETKSYVIISDDPDAPIGIWVHWVVYNIPSGVTEITENIPPSEKLDNGIIQGITDFRKIGYGGPCPPGGIHRYFFKVYALDIMLNLETGVKKDDVEMAMKNHILSKGQLMGRYKRR